MQTMTRGVNTLKAGIFVAIAICLFIFSIYFLGREREIFSSQQDFFTSFKDVKGLSEGAPVRLGGITIGRVTKITFAAGQQEGEIAVTLSVNEKYLDRIKLDSKVSLETQGLLGDKFISISVGKDERVNPPGSFLTVSSTGDIGELMSKASLIVENSVQISDDLKTLSAALRADGTNGLGDTIKEINLLAKNLNAISGEVKNGSGLAHALIYDKSGSDTIKSLGDLTKNLSDASLEISTMMKDIKNGEGLIHDLIYNKDADTQGLADVIQKLNDTAENLKSASEALKNGTGTIGALLVDSQLYDNLVEVTDGAKRSYILRQAVRSSMNKSEQK